MGAYTELVGRIKELRSKGSSKSKIRAELLKSGWDMDSIDQAMREMGYRGGKNIRFYRRVKKNLVAIAVIGLFFATVTAAITYEKNIKELLVSGAKKVQSFGVAGTTDEIVEFGTSLQLTVLSGTGISFDMPDGWVVNSTATESDKDSHLWQIEPLTNTAVRAELEGRYGPLDSDTTDLESVLLDPLSKFLTTINVTVLQSPTHEIEGSLEEWKSGIRAKLDKEDVDIELSEFEEIEVDEVKGYKYLQNFKLYGIDTSTIEYVFLLDEQRLEISIPQINKLAQAESVDNIINSFSF